MTADLTTDLTTDTVSTDTVPPGVVSTDTVSTDTLSTDTVSTDTVPPGIVSTDTVLASVLNSFEQWIEPELHDPYVRSLAITLRQLVRHAGARVQHEPRLLWQDNRDLRELLTVLAERVTERGPAIEAALTHSRIPEDRYPDVTDLRREADALRRCLSDVIDRLWRHEDAEAHRLVRDYLSRQLLRESLWTSEVFVGARR